MADSSIVLKEPPRLYLIRKSCLVIILLITGLSKPVFSTYSLGKLVFSSCVFCLFCVLNSMSPLLLLYYYNLFIYS